MWRNQQIVSLDSRDKTGGSHWDASFTLPDWAKFTDDATHTVTLLDVMVPNSVFPVNDTHNTLYVSESGGSTNVAVALTNGNYSASSFATELQTQLNGSGSLALTYTVTYDTVDELLTVTATGNFRFENSATNSRDLYNEMGFDRDNLDAYAASQVGIGPVNMSGPEYIDFVSNIPSVYGTTNNRKGVLARIPLPVEYGYLSHYQPSIRMAVKIGAHDLNNIQILLREPNGDAWELPASTPYMVTFLVTTERAEGEEGTSVRATRRVYASEPPITEAVVDYFERASKMARYM